MATGNIGLSLEQGANAGGAIMSGYINARDLKIRQQQLALQKASMAINQQNLQIDQGKFAMGLAGQKLSSYAQIYNMGLQSGLDPDVASKQAQDYVSQYYGGIGANAQPGTPPQGGNTQQIGQMGGLPSPQAAPPGAMPPGGGMPQGTPPGGMGGPAATPTTAAAPQSPPNAMAQQLAMSQAAAGRLKASTGPDGIKLQGSALDMAYAANHPVIGNFVKSAAARTLTPRSADNAMTPPTQGPAPVAAPSGQATPLSPPSAPPSAPQAAPQTASGSVYAPIGGKPVVDPSAIDSGLSGGLKGYGQAFVQAGQKYGVDPALLASIAMHETGNGTSRALIQGQNAMGVSNNAGPISFAQNGGIPASIDQMAQRLGQSGIYAPARQSGDIGTLAQIYAPVGAANDPRGLNGGWPEGVTNQYQKFAGAPAASDLSPVPGQSGPPGASPGGGAPSPVRFGAQLAQGGATPTLDSNPRVQQLQSELQQGGMTGAFAQSTLNRMQAAHTAGVPIDHPTPNLNGLALDKRQDVLANLKEAGFKEIEENKDDVETAGAQQEKLKQISALNQAGQTGPWTGMLGEHVQDKIALSNDNLRSINDLSHSLTLQNKPEGVGKIAQSEIPYLNSALPEINKSKAVNSQAIANLNALYQGQKEALDFKQAYFDSNGYTYGAGDKYREYRDANPIIVPTGDKTGQYTVNQNRVPWQKWFQAQNAGVDPKSIASGGSGSPGSGAASSIINRYAQ